MRSFWRKNCKCSYRRRAFLSDFHRYLSTPLSPSRMPHHKTKNPTMTKKLNKEITLPQEWINLQAAELQSHRYCVSRKSYYSCFKGKKKNSEIIYWNILFTLLSNCYQHHKTMIINSQLWKIHTFFCCFLWLRWHFGITQNFVEEIVRNNR